MSPNVATCLTGVNPVKQVATSASTSQDKRSPPVKTSESACRLPPVVSAAPAPVGCGAIALGAVPEAGTTTHRPPNHRGLPTFPDIQDRFFHSYPGFATGGSRREIVETYRTLTSPTRQQQLWSRVMQRSSEFTLQDGTAHASNAPSTAHEYLTLSLTPKLPATSDHRLTFSFIIHFRNAAGMKSLNSVVVIHAIIAAALSRIAPGIPAVGDTGIEPVTSAV